MSLPAPRTRRRLAVLAPALLLLGLTAGCGSDDSPSDAGSGSGETTLTVFAAASLTATFTEMGKEFEKTHDGVTVTFSFGGSSDLATQLQEGAPADVFASADTANMDKVADAGLTDGDPVDFATNTLEIATPPDNPAGITSFDDLTGSGVNLVICAPEVPCGAAAAKVAESAGVTLAPVSEEQSVTDVLGKVTSGEADAGLVYVTDVQAAGSDVLGVPFPESTAAVNTYPVAALGDSDQADLAAEFVELVTGPTGQEILADAGFAQP